MEKKRRVTFMLKLMLMSLVPVILLSFILNFVLVKGYNVTKTVELQFATITVVCELFSFVVTFRVGKNITKIVNGLAEQLNIMGDGDLTVKADEKALKRQDELGDIARKLEELKEEWRHVLSIVQSRTKELVETSNELNNQSQDNARISNDFAKAIEDLADAAISHAEETQTAAKYMSQAGDVVDETSSELDDLISNARKMREAGEKASSTIEELSKSNDEMQSAVKRIAEQTTITNNAANRINDAVEIIDAIAEQTSLLALNASIEAARAGAEGKGFAVVASEIQVLAEQTNSSVKTINQIIEELLNDSKEMVSVMEEVNKSASIQSGKFDLTKAEYGELSSGITASVENVRSMRTYFQELSKETGEVMEGLQTLSGLAEESAASTQQATASYNEMKYRTQIIADATSEVDSICKEVYEVIDKFKIS